MAARTIYKIVSEGEWRAAEAAGRFEGSAVDRQDGFIHFSTAAQAPETAAKHFAGAHDLLLVAVDAAALDLKWEVSRGGALFPHLYGSLPMSAVRRVEPLPLCASGAHRFPDMLEMPDTPAKEE
jgi:uncharacterized protein (DUF952 family)